MCEPETVSLKQSQKNEILRCLLEAGVDPGRFDWVSLERIEQPKRFDFPAGTTVLKGRDNPWFLAIAENRKVWWAPSAQCSSWSLTGTNFEQLLVDVVKPWTRELQKELSEPELWPEDSLATSNIHVLLPSQQNDIYRSLSRHSVHFEGARWSGQGSQTRLKIDSFVLELNWSLGSNRTFHIWEGTVRPGPEKPLEKFRAVGWESMAEVVDRWAQDVGREQREQTISFTSSTESQSTYSDKILSIHLCGIRSFQDVYFSLQKLDKQARMMSVLIGENGTGKTTLLRALALAICPRADANVLLSLPLGPLLGVESNQGTISIRYCDSKGAEKSRTITISRSGPREEVSHEEGDTPKLFAYASGIGRSLESADVPTPKDYRNYQSVKALFDYRTSLANPELVLKRLRDSHNGDFEAILAEWVETLGLPSASRIELPKEGGVTIRLPGRPAISLSSLADGYRLTLAWLLDLYGWAAAAGQPHVGQLSGLLLIDEIERHLHPSMQSTVLSRLRRTYPNLQIIATTHSPLAALGADTGELFVSAIQDNSISIRPGPKMKGLSVEDLVTSEAAFDASAYAPETAKLLEEYDRLSAIAERSFQERERLSTLSRELSQVFREDS